MAGRWTVILGRSVLGALLTGCLSGGPGRAQAAANRPSITVQGEAVADLAPDAAALEVGVDAERPSPSEAVGEVARLSAAVAQAIKAEGVDAREVRTAAVILTPVYPDSPAAGTPSPRAYRASTSITLTVRPPERAGVVLAALVDKGVTAFEGLDFRAADEGRVRDRLRGEAVADARRKAELYVQPLGLHLDGVLEITPEEGPFAVPGPMRARSMAVGATPPIAVEPGLLHLREQVRVRWAIAP